MRQICLDTETTGLDPKDHRIIEIGCIEIINRRITDNHFHCYINPERDVDKGAEQVHGLSRDFLNDKPVFKLIVDDFLAYLAGVDEIIIHNAPFDTGFLDAELTRANATCKRLSKTAKIVDTLKMARAKHPGQKNNLDALCKRYGIDNTHRELHGALVDSDLLARLYLTMTGGQESLFAELTKVDQKQQHLKQTDKSQSVQVKRQGDIPVIFASDEERAAHEDYVAQLKKEGHCLWD